MTTLYMVNVQPELHGRGHVQVLYNICYICVLVQLVMCVGFGRALCLLAGRLAYIYCFAAVA